MGKKGGRDSSNPMSGRPPVIVEVLMGLRKGPRMMGLREQQQRVAIPLQSSAEEGGVVIEDIFDDEITARYFIDDEITKPYSIPLDIV